MTDATTNKPLQVSPDPVAGPYIMLPLDQVRELQGILDAHGIYHYLQENVISLDDGPYTAVIDLGRKANADAVQAILDSVP